MEIFIYYQILLALQSSNDNLSRKKTNKKDMILTFGDNFFLTGVNFYFSFLFLEIKNCIQFCCQSVKFFFCCCLTLFIFIMIVPMMMIMIMITSWILIITIFTFLSFTSLLSLATLFILLMIIIPSMMMMLVS